MNLDIPKSKEPCSWNFSMGPVRVLRNKAYPQSNVFQICNRYVDPES